MAVKRAMAYPEAMLVKSQEIGAGKMMERNAVATNQIRFLMNFLISNLIVLVLP
jgi:hypothetical protein